MRARKIARLGLLTAAAMILSYVEAQLPLFPALPGVKLGLANLAVVYALYRLDGGSALCVSGLRVVLVSLLFGTGASFLYSAVGAALSLGSMWALKKWSKLGVLAVSAVGGVMHNLGQILAAVCITRTAGLFGYFPVLLCTGTAFGALIGVCGGLLVKRVNVEER